SIMASFTPATDIPDLSGKVIFITGGNTGLGKEAALQLAKHKPAHIFIGSRSKERGLAAIADIVAAVPNATLTVVQMDLASLSSVHSAAKQFLASSSRLDILMNNAGIMAVPPGLTADGYEIQFGTNYLGHALLTKLLLPTMLKTAQEPGSDVRIVTLSSKGHQRGRPQVGIQFEELRSTMEATWTVRRYAQSKVANILHSKELARRYPEITAVSLNPGIVRTGLQDALSRTSLLAKIILPIANMFASVGVEEGVCNQLWAATSPDVKTGEYYEPVGKKASGSEPARDMTLAGKLWQWTEDELADPKFKL
ncbi:putative oxidoreductase, partial [Lachnellula subtilissima]